MSLIIQLFFQKTFLKKLLGLWDSFLFSSDQRVQALKMDQLFDHNIQTTKTLIF